MTNVHYCVELGEIHRMEILAMNPLFMRHSAPSPRHGQLLPIGAILPDVLRRYDLLPPAQEPADGCCPVGAATQLEPATTTSLATVDSVPYY